MMDLSVLSKGDRWKSAVRSAEPSSRSPNEKRSTMQKTPPRQTQLSLQSCALLKQCPVPVRLRSGTGKLKFRRYFTIV